MGVGTLWVDKTNPVFMTNKIGNYKVRSIYAARIVSLLRAIK